MSDARLEGELRDCQQALSKVSKELERLRGWMELLLSFPPSLQKTLIVILDLKEASSYDVAELTGKGSTFEMLNLNQLHELGYLAKQRRGKRMFYTVIEDPSIG